MQKHILIFYGETLKMTLTGNEGIDIFVHTIFLNFYIRVSGYCPSDGVFYPIFRLKASFIFFFYIGLNDSHKMILSCSGEATIGLRA